MIDAPQLDYPGASATGAPEAPPRWSVYLDRDRVLRDGGLSCRGAGVQHAARTSVPRSRRLSTHGLVFVTAGEGTYRDERRPGGVPVRAPAIIWLLPGHEHAYGPGPQGWQEHWALFEGTATRGIEGPGGVLRSGPVHPAHRAALEPVLPAFARLRRVLATPGRRSHLIASTVVSFLVGVAVEASAGPSGRATSVVDHVVSTAAAPLTVAERARDLGMTLDAFRLAIRQAT